MPVLDELPVGASVALIRLRSLGDCVLSTPAISLLKSARPDLRIGVVVDPKWAAVYQGNPDLECLLPPEPSAVRRFRPALVVNLHGGTTSAQLTAFSGARWRAAWKHFRFQFLYNIRIPRAQDVLGVERPVHTAEHAASAIFFLGVTAGPVPRASLPISASSKRSQPARPYAVIHPVASEAAKTWPAEDFRKLADFCRNEANLEPVFLGAANDDLSAFRKYTIRQGQSLSDTISLIDRATCFVGNDSGPAHLAAACGLPCTVLFGPSDPAIWGPWRTAATVLRGNPISEIRVEDVMRSIPAGVAA